MNTNFLKTFNKFEEGLESLLQAVPELKMYTGEKTEERSVIENLIKQIQESVPSIYNPEYPATYAFSISSREVGFKTRNNLAFGWKISIDRQTNDITYEFRITVLERNPFANSSAMFSKFTENGWQKQQPKQYPNQPVAAQ